MDQVQKQNVIKQIIEEIYGSTTIAIAGHVSPDGDAVASCLALAMSLNKLGKEIVVLLEEIPKRYHFIGGNEFVKTDDLSGLMPDLFISCDCGAKERMGRFARVFDKTDKTIVIDHHISNISYGKINYVDASSSSASEMVYDILEQMGNMNKEIAQALYTGIIFDTGGLRFKSTSPDTMVKVAKLMSYGIPFNTIYTDIMLSHTYTEAMILSKAIGNMKFMEDLPVTYSHITKEDMDNVGASRADLEGICEYLLNTKGSEIAVFISQSGECQSRASFRSLGFDVNIVASHWGGGGHANAAGATIEMGPKEALQAVLEQISERYNTNGI
ncbi:MAG: bifunctional oligoribonuclease/PAP phosphatase NrnA [Defluviitaleaceae bacterium]|nr:bifunctional oligoribonuclease/PAP phosphatase NrnA [Defluviitaleaceae bacterium]